MIFRLPESWLPGGFTEDCAVEGTACRSAESCADCINLSGCGWSVVREKCFPAHPVAARWLFRHISEMRFLAGLGFGVGATSEFFAESLKLVSCTRFRKTYSCI